LAIDITTVFQQKVHALDAHQSQFYEWLPWIGGYFEQVPANVAEREKWLALREGREITPAIRQSLEKWYGKEKANKAVQVEAFEICEYGSRPSEEEVRRIFPMLKK